MFEMETKNDIETEAFTDELSDEAIDRGEEGKVCSGIMPCRQAD